MILLPITKKKSEKKERMKGSFTLLSYSTSCHNLFPMENYDKKLYDYVTRKENIFLSDVYFLEYLIIDCGYNIELSVVGFLLSLWSKDNHDTIYRIFCHLLSTQEWTYQDIFSKILGTLFYFSFIKNFFSDK